MKSTEPSERSELNDKQKELVVGAIRELLRSMTQADLAKILEVSVPTIARWAIGEPEPSDVGIIRRVMLLVDQTRVWYLTVSPFVLGLWQPLEETTPDERYHGRYVTRISFEPADTGSVRCRLLLDKSFRSLTLFVHSAHKERVGLAAEAHGPGEATLTFHARRAGGGTLVGKRTTRDFRLKEGEEIEFFIIDKITRDAMQQLTIKVPGEELRDVLVGWHPTRPGVALVGEETSRAATVDNLADAVLDAAGLKTAIKRADRLAVFAGEGVEMGDIVPIKSGYRARVFLTKPDLPSEPKYEEHTAPRFALAVGWLFQRLNELAHARKRPWWRQ